MSTILPLSRPMLRLFKVGSLWGHKTIEMTLRYSHLSGEHKANAVKELDGVISTNFSNKDKCDS